MKFIDYATVQLQAGKGGDGCLSFRREKCVPFGGPNGGDGGDGGSVCLVGDEGLNTLVDFRYKRIFRADNGRTGEGSNCRGKSGQDCLIRVPLGTLVYDVDTDELLGDVVSHGFQLKVAQGGFHGLGNARFKSSTNRAPRKITKGTPGEARNLRLELKVLADVGLLGLPNAGKSTLISVVSAAKPKIADYPFTTIHPNLGVVSVEAGRSFVMADIPGLIGGAAEGAGLGLRFLKHLARTKLLLHVIDVLPVDGSNPVESAEVIVKELKKYSETLAAIPRWLVFNKMDLIPEADRKQHCQNILEALGWEGPWFSISALDQMALKPLLYAIIETLESNIDE
jgi:GTPase